jgi:alanine-glyoxylate transaminase / serine-glyoxylate transaminase / serine-pyruvate transaminase
MLDEEGPENAWGCHRRNHLALKDGLEAVGLELFVDEAARLPQLNVVRIPREIDDGAERGSLLDKHGPEIGAGLGELAGKVWRIGLMGYSSRPENVSKCVGALEDVLLDHGLLATAGAGETAVQKAYASL